MSGIELKPISESQTGRSNFLLPLGKTVIGRGSVLGVSDKRVSRNHGVVEVSDGKLKIMSTHTNPTFYQANGTSKLNALPKDVWQYLEHGDRISLTPEQHIYEVVIDDRPMNKESQSLGTSLSESPLKQLSSKQQKQSEDKEQDKEGQENNRTEESTKGSEENIKPNNNDSRTKHSKSDGEDNREDNERDHKTKKDTEQDDPDAGVSKTKTDKADTVTLPGEKEIALPLQRERKLPDWMASLETGQTAEEAKPVTTGSTNRGRGRGRGRPKGAATPSKPRAATTKAKKTSPISDDEGSEEDYKPAVKRTPSRGRGRPRGKGTPRGRGGGAVQPRRAIIEEEQSDEGEGDNDDGDFGKDAVVEGKEDVPRKWGHGKTRDQASVKRRAKLAMDYSEDFMESDVDSEEEEMPVPEGDEGSDWEPDSHSPRLSRSPSKGKRTPGRTSGRTPRRKRTGGRRHSRRSSDDDDSDMSEQEVYVPRPTKRSGRAASSSQELLDDTPRKRIKKADNGKKRREVCQYGKKCYRKKPLHLEEYSHPGDSDYVDEDDDEEEDDEDEGMEEEEEEKEDCPFGSDCYRKNKRHLKEFKHTKAPGRPKRQAAKRKATVVDGASDDDGEENTYDKNDSFLDDGTLETLGDSPVDSPVESDWNPKEEAD